MSTFPPVSPFIQIKAGDGTPPIIIAHGLAGTVQFWELAKHIDTDRPIYGIQARGVDGLEQPFDRVEDMANAYTDAIEALHSHGAYILVGYSFGGLVALEMAQRMTERGKKVALLVLLDAFPHPRFMPAPQRLRLFAKRMKNHARQMSQMSVLSALSYFAKGVMRRLHFPGAIHESQRPPEELGLPFAETALRRVNQKAYLAYSRYQPRFYRGKIKFVATQTQSFFPGHPVTIWGKLAAELDVEVIPGNHLNIVTTEFEALAAVLTRYLKQVPCERI